MPHVSRNKLSFQTEQQLTDTLDLVLSKLTRKESVKDFLLSLLTPTERIMLAKRLAIIILIKEGIPQSQISQTLHVTRITVSRLELFLEARGKGYELALEVLKDEEALKEFKSMLLKLVGYTARAAGGRVKLGIF
ncbi:MAG TPA: Trp family transcriptional regulator [Candidatus Saccharimonadales bacterium]|nr:Trp family transcriptional regulator [Candidatus Saccharimonadales bacterium]